jgi:hypothetical protein
MKLLPTLRALLGLALAASVLVACGGGDDAPIATAPPPDLPIPGTAVPTSATTSAAGALAFVKSMASSADETLDSVELGAAVLATSDTDEPDPGV